MEPLTCAWIFRSTLYIYICMNSYGALNKYYSDAFSVHSIRYSRSWISTPTLRQKLRIGQSSIVAHNSAFGMGLDSKLRARNPI